MRKSSLIVNLRFPLAARASLGLATAGSLAAGLALPADAQGAPVEGTNYARLAQPIPMPATGKVEVVEVFSYACIHCAHFQPLVDAWRAKQSKNVVFTYLPAAWNAQWEGFAKAYYAADSLGIVEKTHGPMFKALHEEKKNFASLDELAQWYAGYGVKPDAFLSAFNSMTTMAGIEHSKALVPQYGIDGTPPVVVAERREQHQLRVAAAELEKREPSPAGRQEPRRAQVHDVADVRKCSHLGRRNTYQHISVPPAPNCNLHVGSEIDVLNGSP